MTLSRDANNFDFIRIAAALCVIIGHSSDVLLNHSLRFDPAKWLTGYSMQSLGVIIFFIISGFLITACFEHKKSWIQFIAGRILRIFPALIVVVLLSVFVLGALLTIIPIKEYLSSPVTGRYLQDITLYRMYYYLPGVFENNPLAGSVNASLWSLPYEFTCYIYIALTGMSAVVRNKWISLLLFIIYFVSYIFYETEINKIVIPIIGIDFKTFFIPFLYFLAGSLFFKFRNHMHYNLTGLLICIVTGIAIRNSVVHQQFFILVITYIILSLAFSEKLQFYKVAKYGDFSYGLYLYAFPVQQLIVYLFPGTLNLLVMMLISILATLPLAYFSWHVIEKPALLLKKYFR